MLRALVEHVERARQRAQLVVAGQQRDDRRVGGDDRLPAEDGVAGRRVDERDVEAPAQRVEQPRELAAVAGEQPRGLAAQALVGGREEGEAAGSVAQRDVLERVADVGVGVLERVLDSRARRVLVQRPAGRQVGLRVEVDHQHREAEVGETRREVGARQRLADPALLAQHGDRDHGAPPRRRWCSTWNIEIPRRRCLLSEPRILTRDGGLTVARGADHGRRQQINGGDLDADVPASFSLVWRYGRQAEGSDRVAVQVSLGSEEDVAAAGEVPVAGRDSHSPGPARQ